MVQRSYADHFKLSRYIPTITVVNHNPQRPDVRIIGAPFFNYHGTFNDTPALVTWDLDLLTFPPQLTFYSLLNASAADYWTSQLLQSSFKALNATGIYVLYDGKFRKSCVIGERDNSVSLVFAQSYNDEEGARFEVEVIDEDHVPMLSRSAAVVDLVRRFAEGQAASEPVSMPKGHEF